MKRYYLSPMIGDGKTPETAWRLKIADFGVNHVGMIPSAADGSPLFNWGLAIVDTIDHTALLADVEIYALPDLSLDAKLSTLTSVQRTALYNKLDGKGINRTGITTQSTFRDVIRRFGTFLIAAFSENNFDVSA